jgi:hypothetical protein
MEGGFVSFIQDVKVMVIKELFHNISPYITIRGAPSWVVSVGIYAQKEAI